MRIFTTVVLTMLSLWANAYAADSNVEVAENALTGRWQEGLTSDLRTRPQQKLSYIHVGNILDFAADHTFRLYPKCPRKSDLEKLGASYIGGSWKITAINRLHIFIEAKGKKVERDVEFSIKGDDLIFISPSNPREQFGKYAGPVPQQCPGR